MALELAKHLGEKKKMKNNTLQKLYCKNSKQFLKKSEF